MGPQRVRYDRATNTTITKFKVGTLLIRGVSKDDISFMSDANLIPPRIYFKFVLMASFFVKCCCFFVKCSISPSTYRLQTFSKALCSRALSDESPKLFDILWASLVAQMVKKLPARQETWVQTLGQENPLEKGMATHSSILAWRIPQTEEPGGL